jgi:membrane-bound lytic murein transglycosylase F
VVTCNTWNEKVVALYDRRGDMIAASSEITPARLQQVAFSNGFLVVQQHLISNRNKTRIRTVYDLGGKIVDVSQGSAYHERLKDLRRQGINVVIRSHDDMAPEHLIQKVARGEIDYTVANTNTAFMSQRYYPATSVQSLLHDTFSLGWAVHPASQVLLEKINAFLQQIAANGRLNDIYEKYHQNIEKFDYLDLKTFHERLRTRLPRYRAFIKDAASKHDFDWCLIAAQMYRESHMDPFARGPNGGQGLMQILPATGRSLKVADAFDPVANIRAGVRYLRSLYDLFEGIADEDRLQIALAAYNVGPGHVQDARRLASRMGLDPNRWGALAQTLPLLRSRKYYQHAEQGFCQGDIPVAYVKNIMSYYDILKRMELDSALAKAIPGTNETFVD